MLSEFQSMSNCASLAHGAGVGIGTTGVSWVGCHDDILTLVTSDDKPFDTNRLSVWYATKQQWHAFLKGNNVYLTAPIPKTPKQSTKLNKIVWCELVHTNMQTQAEKRCWCTMFARHDATLTWVPASEGVSQTHQHKATNHCCSCSTCIRISRINAEPWHQGLVLDKIL